MKYKFNHSKDRAITSIGIKTTKNLSTVVGNLIHKAKDEGNFSEIAEELATKLTKREILFLATMNVTDTISRHKKKNKLIRSILEGQHMTEISVKKRELKDILDFMTGDMSSDTSEKV